MERKQSRGPIKDLERSNVDELRDGLNLLAGQKILESLRVIAPLSSIDEEKELDYGEVLAGKADELTERFNFDWSEITEFSKEDIVSNTAHISEVLQIKSDFFDDPARNLMLFGLVEVGRGGVIQEQHVVSLRKLLQGYSERVVDNLNEDKERNLREEAWLESYTNSKLTEELEKIFYQTEFLSEIRQELNVTQGTEEPFELRVIEVDAAAEKDYAETVSSDSNDQVPEAYNFVQDGKKTLVIRSSQMENLKKFVNDPGSLTDDEQRSLAYIKHEYVHTQKSLLLDSNNEVGIAMEEYRAERTSGSQGGYGNIKDLMTFVILSTDFNAYEAREESYKNPESPTADFMSRIAMGVDLRTMTNLMTMSQPEYDVGFDGSLNSAIVEHIVAKYGEEKYKEYVASIKDKFRSIKFSEIVGGFHKNHALARIIKEVENAV